MFTRKLDYDFPRPHLNCQPGRVLGNEIFLTVLYKNKNLTYYGKWENSRIQNEFVRTYKDSKLIKIHFYDIQ